MPEAQISWPQLVALMALGDGPDPSMRGIGFHGSLVRRPHSHEPWDPLMNWPHMHRWAADGWDWCFEIPESVAAATVATSSGTKGTFWASKMVRFVPLGARRRNFQRGAGWLARSPPMPIATAAAPTPRR